MGGDLHRTDRDAPQLRDHALHRASALGGQGHPAAAQDVGADEKPRRPGRYPACLFRDKRAEFLYPRGAAGADGVADPDLHQRSRPGPRHGPRRHPQPAALVRDRGETLEGGRVRPDLPLRRARVRNLSAFPEPRHQPAQRRIWRQPREPVAFRPRGGRGHARGHRRDHGHHPSCLAGRNHWGSGVLQCRGARLCGHEPRPAGPLGSRAGNLGGLLGPVAVQGRGGTGDPGARHPRADGQATRSCPGRSKRGGSTTSANASAATSASPAT